MSIQGSNNGAAPFVSIDMTGVIPEGAGYENTILNNQDLQVANDTDGAVPFDIPGAFPEGAPGDAGATLRKVAKSLFTVGFFTLLMAVATALYKPPRGVIFERYKLAYYLTLATISVAGMAEVAISFCLSCCGRFAKCILCASVVPFALILSLGGFSVLMRT